MPRSKERERDREREERETTFYLLSFPRSLLSCLPLFISSRLYPLLSPSSFLSCHRLLHALSSSLVCRVSLSIFSLIGILFVSLLSSDSPPLSLVVSVCLYSLSSFLYPFLPPSFIDLISLSISFICSLPSSLSAPFSPLSLLSSVVSFFSLFRPPSLLYFLSLLSLHSITYIK